MTTADKLNDFSSFSSGGPAPTAAPSASAGAAAAGGSGGDAIAGEYATATGDLLAAFKAAGAKMEN